MGLIGGYWAIFLDPLVKWVNEVQTHSASGCRLQDGETHPLPESRSPSCVAAAFRRSKTKNAILIEEVSQLLALLRAFQVPPSAPYFLLPITVYILFFHSCWKQQFLTRSVVSDASGGQETLS